MIALDILKLQLDDFFERSKPQTISKIINKEELYFNKSLFELEKHLFDLKVKYNVNQNLNPGIISENILSSFRERTTFFRSNDYALSFLVFLTMQGSHNAEDLLEMIDKYLDVIKDRLTFHDIVKTDTGATRCYTNLRFSLNELRNFGLVYSNTTISYQKRRSILPTPIGYLISLYINEPYKFNIEKQLPDHGNSSNCFVTKLYSSLKSIRKNPEQFLSILLERYDGIRSLETVIREIFEEYWEAVLQHIEITNEGLKVNEVELEKSISTYYLKMADRVDISLKLKEIVLPLSIPKHL